MKSTKLIIATLVASHFALLAGCSDNEAPKSSATNEPANTPAVTVAANDPHAGMNIRLGPNQGRVMQAESAGGYTYAQVEQNGSTFWIAGNEVTLKAGDIVAWKAKKMMRDFYSKALDVTFDDIYFVSGMETNHASTQLTATQTNFSGFGGSAQGLESGRVISAQSAAGYTYLEVETGGGTTWLAVTETDAVKPGEYVGWSNAASMNNFTSKALNRTFETILFVGAVQPVSPEQAQAQAAATQGKVLSAETAGGYTYMEVETGNGKTWVAAPATKVAVGNVISWSGAAPMRNFNSPSLGRTFDEILFAGSVSLVN